MVDVTEEIIFTGSNPTVDRQTRRLAASRKLRKIHSSIYTSNLTEPLESIGLRHALEIAGHLFPGAVLSGRTAKEMHASRALGQDGSRTGPGFVFLCHVKARRRWRSLVCRSVRYLAPAHSREIFRFSPCTPLPQRGRFSTISPRREAPKAYREH